MKFGLPFLALACLASAASADAPKWNSQSALSEGFQGRWAIVDVKGNVSVTACRKEETASADLVVGPTWFVHKSGTGFLIEIEISGSRDARFKVVDNAGGEVGVTVELMMLSEDGNSLEVASNPEIGFDIMKYRRCPANA